MKKRNVFYGILLVAAVLLIGRPVHANEWRFPLGITYASGFEDVVDLFEDNLRAHGYTVTEEASSWPVGLSFQPYYLYDSGLGIGAGFGPMMIVSADPYFLFVLPVNASVRYVFNQGGSVSPYVRAGVSYYVASGDFATGSKPGPLGAVGIEFMKQKNVGLGFEVSYDSAKIEMEDTANNSTKDVKPGGLMVTAFVVF